MSGQGLSGHQTGMKVASPLAAFLTATQRLSSEIIILAGLGSFFL